MKELDINLRDDLSDISDNAPVPTADEEIEFAEKLDKDRLEFERMLENMKNDMMYLQEDIEIEQEEER